MWYPLQNLSYLIQSKTVLSLSERNRNLEEESRRPFHNPKCTSQVMFRILTHWPIPLKFKPNFSWASLVITRRTVPTQGNEQMISIGRGNCSTCNGSWFCSSSRRLRHANWSYLQLLLGKITTNRIKPSFARGWYPSNGSKVIIFCVKQWGNIFNTAIAREHNTSPISPAISTHT